MTLAFRVRVLAVAGLMLLAPSLSAKELVADFSGKSSTATREFEVEAPWIVDWLVSGEPAQFEAVDISLYNAGTGGFEGAVVRSQTAGNGVRKFDNGGRFYFQVNASMMDWRLRVYHLTAEEASQYTPKG